MYQSFVDKGELIASHFEQREYSRAIREIMGLADEANRFIDHHKPWLMIKDEAQKINTQLVCTQGLNLFRVLALYLKAVIPHIITEAEDFFKAGTLSWTEAGLKPLLNHKVQTFKPLIGRLTTESLDNMTNDSIETTGTPAPVVTGPLATTPLSPEISIEDFSKVDLRIVKIVAAESVAEADKLLKLTLDLGGPTRTVFAGIKSAYAPEDLIGKMTVMVANLSPRKMRFGVSEGMVLAAGPGGKDLWILEPHQGAEAGMKVK